MQSPNRWARAMWVARHAGASESGSVERRAANTHDCYEHGICLGPHTYALARCPPPHRSPPSPHEPPPLPLQVSAHASPADTILSCAHTHDRRLSIYLSLSLTLVIVGLRIVGIAPVIRRRPRAMIHSAARERGKMA